MGGIHMWKQLELPWRIAFEEAWEAYKRGSVPVGAALMDQNGTLVVSGRNAEKDFLEHHIHQHPLAHATLNTVLKIQTTAHKNLEHYRLYMTLEPCPLCLGAILMTDIKHLNFAAKDGLLGGTDLTNSFIVEKKLDIEGPNLLLQSLQIALKTVYLLEQDNIKNQEQIAKLSEYCMCGVQAGEKWHKEGLLRKFRKENVPFAEVYEILLKYLCQ